MNALALDITIGDKYGPAMEMEDEAAARDYFEVLVQHAVAHGLAREEAEAAERSNLGYFAGYYDHQTRLRVERLFQCAHPVFGKASLHMPTPEEALAAGLAIGRGLKGGGA